MREKLNQISKKNKPIGIKSNTTPLNYGATFVNVFQPVVKNEQKRGTRGVSHDPVVAPLIHIRHTSGIQGRPTAHDYTCTQSSQHR